MDEHMITGSMSTRGECVSKKRKKKRLRILSAALAASLVLAGSTVFSQVGYAVSVDGRVVGSGRNIDEIEEAVENVEERVSGILGEEYILDEVSYEKYIGSADTEEELEKAEAARNEQYDNIMEKLDRLIAWQEAEQAKPKKRWEAIVDKSVWAVLAAVIAFILARIGL